jgi:hypothetical protein
MSHVAAMTMTIPDAIQMVKSFESSPKIESNVLNGSIHHTSRKAPTAVYANRSLRPISFTSGTSDMMTIETPSIHGRKT